MKKLINKEMILYIIFGIITTIVNMGSFYILNNIFKINENIANIIAIILAILVAYTTNKNFVFCSKTKNINEEIIQFIKFVMGRAFTITIEFFGCLLLFKLPIPNIIIKFFITIIVVILNFFISKFFAFKKGK